jgi:hypothetical protein
MTRTLENQTLLYDADCPLCRVYTKGFIDVGMLDGNGKKPYCQLSDDEQFFVDVKRASNEIALVDNVNKTVIYGIDSLLKVIGFSFPWMEKVGNWKPVKYFLKKLYSFISYNRKVIIPSRKNKEIKLQCVPDFNYKYRFIYIGFAWLISSFLDFNYLKSLHLEYSNFSLIAFGIFIQMPFQGLFLFNLKKEIILNYIGNLMTISLFGSLVLIPILILNQFLDVNYYFHLIYFGITFLILVYEHYRRLNVLELPKYIIITWVVQLCFMFYSLL